jgi:hypothetical protein
MTMQVIVGEDDPSKRALHEVVIPEGYVPPETVPDPQPPAKVYPFKLDPFQAKVSRTCNRLFDITLVPSVIM